MRKAHQMDINILTMKIAKNKALIRRFSGEKRLIEKLEKDNEHYFSQLKDVEVR